MQPKHAPLIGTHNEGRAWLTNKTPVDDEKRSHRNMREILSEFIAAVL